MKFTKSAEQKRKIIIPSVMPVQGRYFLKKHCQWLIFLNCVFIIICTFVVVRQNCKTEEKSEERSSATSFDFTIYAITPTYSRPAQEAELIRLSQTFLHVKNFYWIVAEDANENTKLVADILAESGLNYTHLNAPRPNNRDYRQIKGNPGRNAGLRWIRANLNESNNGVVYFADDDNVYSLKLFEEMRNIKRVGVWPVGFAGGLLKEGPVCDTVTKKVKEFKAAWAPERPFPIDMAAFAINIKLVFEKKNAEFGYDGKFGWKEPEFLAKITTRDELECFSGNARINVWHTRTANPNLNLENKFF